VDALGQQLQAPCLARIPRLDSPQAAAVAAQFPFDALLAALRR